MSSPRVSSVLASLLVAATLTACGTTDTTNPGTSVASTTLPPITSVSPPWYEVDVAIPFEGGSLFGVLTYPAGDGPHPGVVLLSGSGDETGPRAGVDSRYLADHSHRFAVAGYAALRYDPPGVGQSGGDLGLPSLERRVGETRAALEVMRSRPEVATDSIGLWGVSQGPWVAALTAARHPEEIAFIISLVGAGVSVHEQQIYGIEAQTRAEGHSEQDVTKAVTLGQLLIDWQILEPIYEEGTRSAVADLDDELLNAFATVVYEPSNDTPGGELRRGAEILGSIAEEAWASKLHLKELYLPQFDAIPLDISEADMAAIRQTLTTDLMTDPADFLPEVTAPLLAIFGENDLNVPTERSVELFDEYLTAGGNPGFTLVVIPDVGHDIFPDTPGYWDTVVEWMAERLVD